MTYVNGPALVSRLVRRDLGNIGLAFPHSVGVQTAQLDRAPDYEFGGQTSKSLSGAPIKSET